MNTVNFTLLLVKECDLALHFTARLVQMMVFNATRLNYRHGIKGLRKIAEAWYKNKAETLKMISIINEVKQAVANQQSAYSIWQKVANIEPAAVTWLQKDFMDMLERNRMLQYCLEKPTSEDTEALLQGEHPFELLVSGSALMKASQWKPKHAENHWILMSATTHGHVMVIPVRWEGSVVKVILLGHNKLG